MLLELLKIPGMGPKGVKAVYENIKVKSAADLKMAIENGKLLERFTLTFADYVDNA